MSSTSPSQETIDRRPDAVTVRPYEAADTAAWDAFVERSAAGTFFHLSGWARVLQATFGHTPYYRVAERDGRIVGVLPLARINSRLFGDRLISTPFCVTGGPLAQDAVVADGLSQEASRLADALNVAYVEYRGAAVPTDGWIAESETYAGFSREMESDDETEMKRIPRKQRAVVRKSLKNGLADTIDGDPERFRRLYAESLRNLGTPMFPRTYFENLVSVFGDACEILTVCKDDEPLCSVLSFYFKDRVMPYYTGGRDAARRLGANDFMYWRLMRRAADKGYKVFDFGRSKLESGPYHFKKNWGFEPEPIVHSYYLRTVADIPKVNPNNPRYAVFIGLWRRLPIPVANTLGPWIVRGTG